MTQFKKHKKLYYVPGMISLLVIPLVFWYLGNQYLKENDFRVINFNMPPKDFFQNNPEWDSIQTYQFTNINVPINFSHQVENDYYNLIKELKKKNIDKTGIKFQLSDKNTYGDFVKILNLMELTKQSRDGLFTADDCFYVLNIRQNKENVMMCGGVIYSDFYCGNSAKNNLLSRFLLSVFKILKQNFILIFSFMILVAMSIFRPKIFIPF